MSVGVEIRIVSPLWRAYPRARRHAREALNAALAECGLGIRENAEAGLRLTDDAEIRALNARWRGRDEPTNVLSFPAAEGKALSDRPLIGDVVVAFETVEREAEAEGKSFEDHFRHLVVHGFLHLLGFDHQAEAEALRMEAVEGRALQRLGVADPYAGLELVKEPT